MKNLKITMKYLRALTFGFCAVAFVSPAEAATVNLFGDTETLGAVTIGQTGTLDNYFQSVTPVTSPATGYFNAIAQGILPADSEIVLDYTFLDHFGTHGILGANATYIQNEAPLKYVSFASTYSAQSSFVFNSTTNTTSNSVAPILAMANVSANGSTGVVTIINDSGVAVPFESFFGLYLVNGKLDITSALMASATYKVSAISPVPLPPALSLFCAAFLGLLGFAFLQKRTIKVLK